MLFVIVGDLWNYACLLGLGVVIISDEWVLSVQTLTGLSVSIYVYADSCAVLIWWCYSLVCFRYWSTQCVTTSSPGTGRSVTTMPFWWTSGSAFRKWSSPLLAGMHSWRAQLQIYASGEWNTYLTGAKYLFDRCHCQCNRMLIRN